MNKITKINSFAKINLFLKIIDKKDNYHHLESLFAFIDLKDEIEIKENNEFKLEIKSDFSEFIDLDDNIFTQILNYFEKKFKIHKNFHIKLNKNIPVGAGLGGGSSNGAALINFLNNYFNLNLSKEKLQEISLNFGSDIAFFFEDKASLIRGRGEEITNFNEFLNIPALLINPKIHLSTKDVFNNFGNDFSAKISNEDLFQKDILDLIEIDNDLTNSAIWLCPIIKDILEELNKSKAKISKMSGSGTTCFGIFKNENDLEAAQIELTKKFPEFLIKQVKILYKI